MSGRLLMRQLSWDISRKINSGNTKYGTASWIIIGLGWTLVLNQNVSLVLAYPEIRCCGRVTFYFSIDWQINSMSRKTLLVVLSLMHLLHEKQKNRRGHLIQNGLPICIEWFQSLKSLRWIEVWMNLLLTLLKQSISFHTSPLFWGCRELDISWWFTHK